MGEASLQVADAATELPRPHEAGTALSDGRETQHQSRPSAKEPSERHGPRAGLVPEAAVEEHPGGAEAPSLAERRPEAGAEAHVEPRAIPPLLTTDALQARIAALAIEIRHDRPTDDLHLIGVLKGAVFFLADLVRVMEGRVSIDFMALSSYGGGTTPGELTLLKDLEEPLGTGSVAVEVEGQEGCNDRTR